MNAPLRDAVAGLLAMAATLAFAVGGGWLLGYHHASQKHLQQLRQQAQALGQAIDRALDIERTRGQAAADTLQQQLHAQRTYASDLEAKARHAPLVVQPAQCAPAAAAHVAAFRATITRLQRELAQHRGAGATGAQPQAHPDDAALAVAAAPPGTAQQDAIAHPAPSAAEPAHSPGVRFTLAAVSLWNSAHAGADMPAGACSAADPTSPACAADSGATEHDVWRNQRDNAQRWGQCRAQLNALIDLLCQRPGQSGCGGAAPALPGPH